MAWRKINPACEDMFLSLNCSTYHSANRQKGYTESELLPYGHSLVFTGAINITPMKGYLLGKVIFPLTFIISRKVFCFNTHILAYNYCNKVCFFTLGDCCQYYEIMAMVVKIREVTTFPHTHTPTLQLILNSFGGKMQTFKLFLPNSMHSVFNFFFKTICVVRIQQLHMVMEKKKIILN